MNSTPSCNCGSESESGADSLRSLSLCALSANSISSESWQSLRRNEQDRQHACVDPPGRVRSALVEGHVPSVAVHSHGKERLKDAGRSLSDAGRYHVVAGTLVSSNQ